MEIRPLSIPGDDVLRSLNLSISSERKRKSSTKVRTGCLTCKSRRVKCDETKPSCLRCQKFRVDCDGYNLELASKPSRLKVVIKRLILPKKSTALQKVLRSTAKASTLPPNFVSPSPATIPPSLLPSSDCFESELNSQCFRSYLENAAKVIGGPFQTSLWERVIPQISQTEPFIRNVMVAIGALSIERKTSPCFDNSPYQPDTYQFALIKYGRSIQGMREAISNGQHDLQKAMVACILVFCFEGMLGNTTLALAHAESGLMLLHNWAKSIQLPKSQISAQKAWMDRFQEGDLIDAFRALDSHVLGFTDQRSVAVHEYIQNRKSQAIEKMPSEFDDLIIARRYCTFIINRNYHFSKSIQACQVTHSRDLPESFLDTLGGKIQTSGSDSRVLSLREELSIYQSDMERWSQACVGIFAQTQAGTDQYEKIAVAILQIRMKLSHIMLESAVFITEIQYDVFSPEFISIVELSEIVLSKICDHSHTDSESSFHFDVGIVPALFFVASRCRFGYARKRAIEILFALKTREGIWDSVAVAHVAGWQRKIEIEGLVPGAWIPEERRIVINEFDIDLPNKRVMITAFQGPKEASVQRNTLLTW